MADGNLPPPEMAPSRDLNKAGIVPKDDVAPVHPTEAIRTVDIERSGTMIDTEVAGDATPCSLCRCLDVILNSVSVIYYFQIQHHLGDAGACR